MEYLFLEAKLRQLHRRFGYFNAEKLYTLLRRMDYKVNRNTRQTLEIISCEYEPYQRNAQAPRRFKFALHDNKQFNNIIFINVYYIDGCPVLHVVDEVINY